MSTILLFFLFFISLFFAFLETILTFVPFMLTRSDLGTLTYCPNKYVTKKRMYSSKTKYWSTKYSKVAPNIVKCLKEKNVFADESIIILQIHTRLLWKYYRNTTEVLQLYYRILQATTGHYGQYSHYRFHGKIPWFADEVESIVSKIDMLEEKGTQIQVEFKGGYRR